MTSTNDRLLDCGLCYEENGEEVHPHPECPVGRPVPAPVGFLTVPLANGGTWTYLSRLTDGRVMCCLCFDYCTRDQLSRDQDGQLTDVCQDCRDRENACQTARAKEPPMSYPELLTAQEKLAAAKYGLSLPPIVVICGSTRFMAEMVEADVERTAGGYIVVKPGCDMKTPHPLWADPDDAERIKAALDDLHRAKIRLADLVLIVGDYAGDSTRSEIAYARELGKPIEFADATLAAEFATPTP